MSNLTQRVADRFLAKTRIAKAKIPFEMITDYNTRMNRSTRETIEFYLDAMNSGRKSKGWLKDIMRDWENFAEGNRRYWVGMDIENYYNEYKRKRVDFKAVYKSLKELYDLV